MIESPTGTVKLTDLRIYSAPWTLPKLLILHSAPIDFASKPREFYLT